MKNKIVLFLSMVCILSSLNSYGQLEKKDVFYYIKDSSLMQFNPQNNSVKLIYKPKKGTKIVNFVNHWKQGNIALIQDSTHSRILRIKRLSPLHIDTIFSVYNSGGEGFQLISDINISPTGDFMVLDMTYWEWHGIQLFDFRKDSLLEPIKGITYLTDFIKWIPFNSILVTEAHGSEVDGPGDLFIHNLNLENHLYKSYAIPNTLYEGFYEWNDGIAILCTPESYHDRQPKGLVLHHGDLWEVLDSTDKANLSISVEEKNLKVKMKSIDTTSFAVVLSNSIDNKLIFDKKYKLEYPPLDVFEFRSMEYNSSTKTLIVKFEVSVKFSKDARENFGYVSYYIDLSGQLLKKVYDNVSVYRVGFDVETFEHIFNSKGCTIKKYTNGKLKTSFKSRKFVSNVPNEIIIK